MTRPALAGIPAPESPAETDEPQFELTPTALAYLARMGLPTQSRRRAVRGGR